MDVQKAGRTSAWAADGKSDPAIECMLIAVGTGCTACALYLLCSGVAFAKCGDAPTCAALSAVFVALVAVVAIGAVRFGRPVLGTAGSCAYRAIAAVVAASLVAGFAVEVLAAVGVLLFLVLPLLAFSCVAMAIFWATSLSSYTPGQSRMIVCGDLAAVGVVGLIARDPQVASAVAMCVLMLSFVCMFVSWKRFRGNETKAALAVRAEVQIEVLSFVVDFLTGLALGVAASMGLHLWQCGVRPDELLFWSSSAVVAAAGASAVCMMVFRERYFWVSKHLHAFLLTPALLAFALLPDEGLLAVFGYAVFVASLFFCIHATASVEFLRYYNDHPLRIECGSAFSAGLGMLAALCLFSIARGVAPAGAVSIACAVVVMLLLGVHLIIIFFCSYPFDDQFNLNSRVVSGDEEGEGKGRLRRYAQIEAVAQRYGLTAREREILELMARGRNARYISDKLTISPSTTKTHVYHLYAKLGVHTQQDLIDLVEGVAV